MDTEEYEGLQRKALGVEEFPSHFDPRKEPQTGEEYIHHVMYEAKNCKEWVTVKLDKEKMEKKQTVVFTEPSRCVSAPQSILPSTEWQKKQISDFSAFRLHIQKLKNQNLISNPPPFNGESKQWLKRCSKEPTLTDILELSYRSMCKILEYINKWLKDIPAGESIPTSWGVWLYALLSSIDIPLTPDACSTLREIARNISVIRSVLPVPCDEDLYKPLNVFICIISRYFNNFDLIDNANEL